MQTQFHTAGHGQEPASLVDIVGSLLMIDGRKHRFVARMMDRLLLLDVVSHHVFLAQDVGGVIGLPTSADLQSLIRAGRCSRAGPLPTVLPDPIERMRVQIELLDAARVGNGVKSIWLHLSAVWTEDLQRRFGDFDDPASIRRWRTARRKAAVAARVASANGSENGGRATPSRPTG